MQDEMNENTEWQPGIQYNAAARLPITFVVNMDAAMAEHDPFHDCYEPSGFCGCMGSRCRCVRPQYDVRLGEVANELEWFNSPITSAVWSEVK